MLFIRPIFERFMFIKLIIFVIFPLSKYTGKFILMVNVNIFSGRATIPLRSTTKIEICIAKYSY